MPPLYRPQFQSFHIQKFAFVGSKSGPYAAELYIFLTHSSSGNFAETRDGLDSRGADRHRVSPNHPKFHQNSPRAVDEWGNELFLMF